jgi:hypothetical protein
MITVSWTEYLHRLLFSRGASDTPKFVKNPLAAEKGRTRVHMAAIGSLFLIRLAKQASLALALGVVLRGLVPAQAASPSFECFAVSDLVRVFEDGHRTATDGRKSLSLFGLQNETVSAQCVASAMEDLADLTVSVDPLRQTEGSAIIPGEDIRWDFVGGIFIEKNTPNRPKRDLTRAAPAWFPDYLSEDRHCNIRKGAQKAVYLTVKIPSDASPGEYRGAVTFTAGNGSNSLPLLLKVYPLKLPEQRHLMATEWFSTSQFRKHHNVNSGDEARFFDMLKVYAENMAEHRQNAFRLDLSLVESVRTPDSKLRFDFSQFDRWAKVFWDTGHMDLLETGFVATFGEGGWSSTNILLRDFPVKEENTGRRTKMAGTEFLPRFLPALVNHLQEKGWLERTVFHICDEPSNHNIMAWREASDFVHRYAPQLRRIDAIETPHCLGELEVWVPKLDHLATWQDVYEQAQRKGNELWFYTVGIFQGGSLLNKTADVPLIESRLMHWLNYRYGLNGYTTGDSMLGRTTRLMLPASTEATAGMFIPNRTACSTRCVGNRCAMDCRITNACGYWKTPLPRSRLHSLHASPLSSNPGAVAWRLPRGWSGLTRTIPRIPKCFTAPDVRRLRKPWPWISIRACSCRPTRWRTHRWLEIAPSTSTVGRSRGRPSMSTASRSQ